MCITCIYLYTYLFFYLRIFIYIIIETKQYIMANDKQTQNAIVRQNQSSNVRQLLKDKGMIGYVSTYELAVYVQLWSDFCEQGLTPEIKKRFQSFDKIMEERIQSAKSEIDGLLVD